MKTKKANTKIRKLNNKNCMIAPELIKKKIDFEWDMGNDKKILFVGGILTKLEGNKQFFIVDGNWQECVH